MRIYVQRNMLAYSTGHRHAWRERLPMRKSAAAAAGSTKCGFPNGAAELWTRGRGNQPRQPREARSADFRMARLNCGRAECGHGDGDNMELSKRLNAVASLVTDGYRL